MDLKNLRKLRESKKQTQLNLAMQVDVQQETISSYENGKTTPTMETLIKLCKYYNCSADYLLDLTDVKLPVNELLINNLDVTEANLISNFRKLNHQNKNKVLGFIEALL